MDNVLALAYLGDAIYEVYIRKHLIDKGIVKVNDLQKEAVNYVSAKAMSKYLLKMMDDNFFTEDEIDIIKRGRNHKSRNPRHVDVQTYHNATGLETLIGDLYMNNNIKRIDEIMEYILKEDLC